MELIELNNTYANQEFDLIIPGNKNNIHVLLQTDDNDTLLMSVYINNVLTGMPVICFANQYVIPFLYIVELLGGNFIFETTNENYPNYKDFGTNCNLFFVPLDEMNA